MPITSEEKMSLLQSHKDQEKQQNSVNYTAVIQNEKPDEQEIDTRTPQEALIESVVKSLSIITIFIGVGVLVYMELEGESSLSVLAVSVSLSLSHSVSSK